MKRVLTAELGSCLGQEVTVMGWVLRMRILSKVTFLLLRDRSGTVQAVLDPALLKAQPISTESVVKIRGVVKAEPRSRLGFELAAEEIEVLAFADQLPFNVNG